MFFRKVLKNTEGWQQCTALLDRRSTTELLRQLNGWAEISKINTNSLSVSQSPSVLHCNRNQTHWLMDNS